MAKRNAGRVEIVGLDDLRRDLKNMPKDIQRTFNKEMKAAAEIVAAEARSRVPSKTGTAADGISAVGGKDPGVKESRTPAYLRWLDFGSREPRSGNTRKEGPWRGSGAGPKGGRFLYPAFDDKWDEVLKATDDAVVKAAKQAEFH